MFHINGAEFLHLQNAGLSTVYHIFPAVYKHRIGKFIIQNRHSFFKQIFEQIYKTDKFDG